MDLRTKKVGSCTLYEGTNGYWNRASFGRRASEAFRQMLLGTGSTEDYVRELRAQVEERREVHRLIGRPARGRFGRWRLQRHLAAGGQLSHAED